MTQPDSLNSVVPAAAPIEQLTHILDCFSAGPMRARENIDRLVEADKSAFLDAATPLILLAKTDQGYRYLLAQMLAKGFFVEIVCNTARMDSVAGVTFLRAAVKMDPQFDVKLTRWLLDEGNRQWLTSMGSQSETLLDVLAEASPGNRLLPLVIQFLRSKGEHVSSKAALLVAQRSQQVELALADPDPRVRANAVEALWGLDTQKARRTLYNAIDDSNNRVVGNALLGLLKLKERSATIRLSAMARHQDPLFRASAAWVMGQTRDRRYVQFLEDIQGKDVETVGAVAVKALDVIRGPKGQAPPPTEITMRILRLCGDTGGKWRIALHTVLPDAAAKSQLTGRVVLDGEEVTAVQVRRIRAGSLAVGVLLPAVWIDEVHPAARALVNNRRAMDRMAIARYSTTSMAEGGTSAGGYSPIRGLSLAHDSNRPKARVVYSLEPPFPPRLMKEPPGIPNLFDSLGALIEAPAGLASHAGVILVAPPSPAFEQEASQESLLELFSKADSHGGSIHAITTADFPESSLKLLHSLCRGTGGMVLRGGRDLSMTNLMDALYRHLTDGVELTFRGKPDAKSITISLMGEEFQGHVACDLPVAPEPNRWGETIRYW
ncbi:MAG: HEAT repeat domain-containing protein [Bryobacteraceae bacterium]